MSDITTIAAGYCFLEGPRWRPDGLYCSDLRDDRVLRVSPDGDVEVVVEAPHPCGLGWLPDGRLLMVSTRPRQVLRVEADGSVVVHADATGVEEFMLNDMVVDRSGHAYVGRWGYDLWSGDDPVAVGLLRIGPDGSIRETGSDLVLSNGMAITTDERRVIVVETIGRRLTMFDITDDGSLVNRRPFAPIDAARPDGLCLDETDAVWLADFGGSSFVRVREGGEVTDCLEVPGRKAVACALGGDDGRTLFLLTASGRTDRDGAREDRSARIEVARVDVPGCERP